MKKSGKFLGVLLAVCMVITMNTVSAYTDSGVQDTKWDEYAATEFAGGTGTKDDPYRIENGEQLAKLAKDVSAGNTHKGEYFRLEKDIDLSAHRWIPIGDYGGISYISFEGFLDGNCKTISGMVVDQSKDKQSAGLFGYIFNTTAGNEVGVKDLTIANAALYVDESIMVGPAQYVSAGILVAGSMANPGYKGTVVFENISVSGTITVKATKGSHKIGGLIGEDNRGIVRKCATDVTITGASNTGGMTGISCDTRFENCTAKGRISGLWALGGFVGYASSSTMNDKTTESTFINCIADVVVEASDWNAGGFVGSADFGMFKNSASFGTVTSTVTEWEARVGGFIGGAGKVNSNVNFVCCHSASLVTYDEKNPYGGWGGFAGKLVAGTTDGCSFIEQKNPKLNGIGINETGQQVEECTMQKNLSKICEDVYGGHHYAAELTVDQEATCSEEGSGSYHCIRCDAKGRIVVIPKKEHSYSTEWSKDEASHWHECTECGAKTDEAEHTDTDKNHKCDVCEKVLSECADINKDHKCDLCGKTLSEHSGGKATCTDKAICEICSEKYGAVDPDNHTDITEWVQTETKHTQKYKCCGAVTVAEEDHEWENGVCSECGYGCRHIYEWQSENGMYWQHCTICGFDTNKKAISTILINGADKVCRTQDYKFSFILPEGATDATCGYEFIGLGDGSLMPTVEDNLYSGILEATIYPAEENSFKLIVSAKTADGLEFSAEKTVMIQNAHSGGTATCTEQATCEICGEKYGDLKPHSYSTEWSTDEASHWHECTGCGAKTDEAEHTDTDKNHKCDVCEKVLSECADTNRDHKCDLCGKTLSEHSGGKATCTDKAICEICSEKYGDLKPHSYSTEWSTDEASHWHECTGCGAKTDEAEHTDTDKNHKCDVCEKVLSECADTNKDHKCDLCGKTLSEHSGGKATCKDKAKCEFCGESYGELDANSHADLRHIDAVAATKTAEGNIECWYCADCGKYYKDAKATQEITKEQTVAAKLPSDNNTSTGDSTSNNNKPSSDIATSPQTGDNSNLALWVSILFVSGGAGIVATVCGRKKKRSVK